MISKAMWFWLIYVLAVVLRISIQWAKSDAAPAQGRINVASEVILYILVGLIGWAEFDGPMGK